MIYGLVLIALMSLVYGPALWVKFVMKRHAKDRPGMPGTGAELAQHLIERFDIEGCKVELAEVAGKGVGDHFSPADNAVRLSEENYHGKSLTAVAVAAHEVGHALQCHRQERIFKLRSRYLPLAVKLRQLGTFAFVLFPIVALLLRSPPLMFLVIGIGVLLQLLGAMMYLIVLPEEWDASFNKALPVLAEGYIPEEHMPAARQVLKAAALTYFAAALADVLNIARWLMLVLRR